MVGVDWVQQSLMRSSGVCSEEDFEITGDQSFGRTNGARLSRQSREQQNAPMLQRYAVYCQPPFDYSLPKPSMITLLKTMGATGNTHSILHPILRSLTLSPASLRPSRRSSQCAKSGESSDYLGECKPRSRHPVPVAETVLPFVAEYVRRV